MKINIYLHRESRYFRCAYAFDISFYIVGDNIMGSYKRFSKQVAPADRQACTVAELLYVMSNGKRLQMLTHLLSNEMSVGALAQAVDLCQSATSQHLAKLNALNLTERRREAQTVYYKVTSEQVRRIIEVCTSSALTEPYTH